MLPHPGPPGKRKRTESEAGSWWAFWTRQGHRWHGMEQTHRLPAAMKTGLRTRHGSGPSIRDAPRGCRSQLKSALRPERWSTGNFTFVTLKSDRGEHLERPGNGYGGPMEGVRSLSD